MWGRAWVLGLVYLGLNPDASAYQHVTSLCLGVLKCEDMARPTANAQKLLVLIKAISWVFNAAVRLPPHSQPLPMVGRAPFPAPLYSQGNRLRLVHLGARPDLAQEFF